MSKTRQHWQQDNKDYTFNQYSFYLLLLGLLLVGLLVAYIFFLRPPVIPRTHLVTIISKPGGELPVIPFQTEDDAALAGTFKNYSRYEFDDEAGFQQNVLEKLKTACEENQDVDTVVIWLSAIGDVRDGRPVILGSAPNEMIGLEDVLRQLSELKAQSVVLLLDCGHAYVRSAAYQDASLGSDFNPFADAVLESLTHQADGSNVQVLVNGRSGERPLYSITRRRSLLGYALENVFVNNDQPVWNVNELHTSLDESSLAFGGMIAPQILRLYESQENLNFRRPGMFADDLPEEEKDDEEELPDPGLVTMTKDAKKMSDTLNKAWLALEQKREQLAISPAVLDPVNWRTSTESLIGLSADQLQLSGTIQDFTRSCRSIPLSLQDFEEPWRIKATRINENLNLFPNPELEEAEPTIVIEKRTVAQAYINAYDVQQRLPHYVALADSLSWLYPTDDAVEKFRRAVMEVTELLKKLSPMNAPAFAPLQPHVPSLDDYDDIDNGWGQLERSEQRLWNQLVFVCRNLVPETRGFQREMVVEALLRLPFIPAQPPEKLDPEFTSQRRMPSRVELEGYLIVDNPPNDFPRVAASGRETASLKRIELYRQISKNWFGPLRGENPLSLRLQTFAYRLSVPAFSFEDFSVRDRTPRIRVAANQRNELLSGANYIERTATKLDLGLEVQNTEVIVRCQLIQGDEFFSFPNGEKNEFDFRADPELIALQDSPEIDPDCKLHVTIIDKNDVSKVYDEFVIPIRLPSNNAIDLIVDVGGQQVIFRQDATGDPIRPFANRPDLPCQFSLRNNWHRDRQGSVTLYACQSPATPTIPGKINDEIRTKTLEAINRNAISPIAKAEISLPKSSRDSATPVSIDWKKIAEDDQPGVVSAHHGLLCIIDRDDSPADWQYWIPVFPVEKPIVAIEARVESDDLDLMVDRQSFFPDDRSVELQWRFTDDQLSGGKALLGVGQGTLKLPVARNLSQTLKSGSYLYVDVDGWPRKYVFEFNGRKFRTAPTSDATATVRLAGDPKTAGELISLPGAGDWIRFGTNSSNRNLIVRLSPNVPLDGAFNFSNGDDHLSLFSTGDPHPLYYPREIKISALLNDKSGSVDVVSKVSDYELTFNDVGSKFQIAPKLHLGSREISLDGSNRIEVQFDETEPKIEDYRVSNTSPIYPAGPVRVVVKASDGDGVGFSWSRDAKIYLSQRNGSLSDLGKPSPAKAISAEGSFEIEAPLELGKYTLGVSITDRVGNRAEDLKANRVTFEVVEKPKAKVVIKRPPPPPKVHTHTLVVVLQANDLNNVGEIAVVIDPEDASAERSGSNYVFKDLNGGVRYKISASGKLKSGISKGAELQASSQQTFPAKAKSSHTSTKTLKLAR